MERGRNATFTVLAGMLFLLVALAALLLVMLLPRAHRNEARPQVAQLQPVACPAGSHAPVCYQTSVTNTGTGAGQITCQVTAASDTIAEFANKQVTYTTPVETPVQVNGSFTLTVLAKPVTGHKTVTGTPVVVCAAGG